MTSVDLISNILTCLIPPDSSLTQAWFSSLSLVHPSWSQPVFFALHQHPIISSITQLLSFQDSFRIHLDRLGMIEEHMLDYDRHKKLLNKMGYSRTGVPSACAVRSMLINLYPTNIQSTGLLEMVFQEKLRKHLQLSKELYLDPGFFSSLSNLSAIHLSMIKISLNNFTFLLSNLSNSLMDLGIHDVFFVGLTSITPFDSIFNLPFLKSLSLTGWLATAYCILPVLQNHPENLGAKRSLKALCLSDAGLKSGATILEPQQLTSCLSSHFEAINKRVDLECDTALVESPTSPKYSKLNPLKIMNYRLCTSNQQWHEPIIMKHLTELAGRFGIQVQVIHPLDTLERIQWMSRYI